MFRLPLIASAGCVNVGAIKVSPQLELTKLGYNATNKNRNRNVTRRRDGLVLGADAVHMCGHYTAEG